jgi:V/A-type H+-transporting ATPase subunit D
VNILANIKVNPTRMELSRLKKKLKIAMRGHKLLKDKRDELMRIFLKLIRKNKTLRQNVENNILISNKNFATARASMSREAVNVALMVPKQEIKIKVSSKNVMSTLIPQFAYKNGIYSENDIYSYGLAFTSGDLDFAVGSLTNILPDMIHLAECEKSCQLIAAEIEKTRRRVNALEHVVIPDTLESIKYITMKLDENERSTQIRLIKVKDMILKQSRGCKAN